MSASSLDSNWFVCFFVFYTLPAEHRSSWIVLFHNTNFRNILVNILNKFVTLSFVSDKLSHKKSKIKRFSKKS